MKIFISYRREDAGGYTKLLADKLQARYGEEEFFFDRHTIRPGEDFTSRIEGTLVSCKGVLAAVGKDWLTVTEKGTDKRRIDTPQDWVRREIATTLRRRIPLVPVVLPGAEMPGAAQLPEELKDFANKNATFLHAENFDEELKSLYDYLEKEFGLKPKGKPRSYALLATAAGFTVVIILGAILIPPPPPLEPYKITVTVTGPPDEAINQKCTNEIENKLDVRVANGPLVKDVKKISSREWAFTIPDPQSKDTVFVDFVANVDAPDCKFTSKSSELKLETDKTISHFLRLEPYAAQ